MAAPSRSSIVWLLIVVVALIAYGSLYPFNFKPDAIEGGVLAALEQLSWARAGRSDHIANVLLYLPLGFCLFLWLTTRLGRASALLLATLLGAALSLAFEVAQVYVSARVPSLKDLALNSFGTALGAAGGLLWHGIARLMHVPAHDEAPRRDPGAAFVVATWLIFRFAPFVPQLDLGKLKAALRPLFEPHWDALSVFIYLVCWLIVYEALAALVRRARRLEALLFVIAAVLVGRLVVTNQTFVADELCALLLLLPTLVFVHRATERVRSATLLGGLLAVLLIESLAPFDFAAPAATFDFWPFMIWFKLGPQAALDAIEWSSLLGRVFLFTALLWLLCDRGVRAQNAMLCVAALSIAIEIAQLWLPDQHASLTDPAIALALGWIFSRFAPRRTSRYGSSLIARRGRSR
jgi:VanZ family protein